MEWLTDPQAWIAMVTLTLLEIVLGIDNIVFISILTSKLPRHQQARGRTIGLGLALLSRLALLFTISWMIRLTAPLFSAFGQEFSGRDIILIVGGLFLLAKSTHEIHNRLEGEEDQATGRGPASLVSTLLQIMVLDVVFSLDSVITAVGMAKDLGVMIAAVVIAVGFMMLSAGAISNFVHRHPTVKMLALSFLLLIGVSLIGEGFGQHIAKGYIYFAMAFSMLVEMLNLKSRRKTTPAPIELREPHIRR